MSFYNRCLFYLRLNALTRRHVKIEFYGVALKELTGNQ